MAPWRQASFLSLFAVILLSGFISTKCNSLSVLDFFFLRFIYLMSALGLPLGAWTLRCCTQAFSSYNERDSCVARASHCRGFSFCRAWTLGHVNSEAAACRLNCSAACGILVPGPGIEPMSLALAGRFLTTEPPEREK